MQGTIFCVTALIVLCALAYATIMCPPSWSSCGNLCFNPSIQYCTESNTVHYKIAKRNTPDNETKCEQEGWQVCAKTCYNPLNQTCQNDTIVDNDPEVPSVDDQDHGNVTEALTCDSVRCPGAASCCSDAFFGPVCYFELLHSCTEMENGTFRFCNCSTCLPCGESMSCYNNETHACEDGEIVPNEGEPEQPIVLLNCSNLQCENDDECCDDVLAGAMCFSSENGTCSKAENGTFRFCGCASCFPCGDQFRCYNNDTHDCIDGEIIIKEVSGNTTEPELPQCSAALCRQDTKCCDDAIDGATCYFESNHTCTEFEDGKFRYCDCLTCVPCGENLTCYDNTTHECMDGEIVPIETPLANCSATTCLVGLACCDDIMQGSVCYNETVESCSELDNGTFRYCDCASCLPCGKQFDCYNNLTHVCEDGEVIIRNITVPELPDDQDNTTCAATCGSNLTCYDNTTQECVDGEVVPIEPENPTCAATTCFAGYGCCDDQLEGAKCYNETIQTCHKSENGTFRFCNCTECLPCGDNIECYNNATHECVDGEIVPIEEPESCNVADCTEGAKCCDDILEGPICYFEDEHTCTALGNETFRFCPCLNCLPCGEGNICFNNDTHACIDGEVVSNQKDPTNCSEAECTEGTTCCDDVLLGPLCFVANQSTCTDVGNGTFRFCNCENCVPCGETLICFDTEFNACVNGEIISKNDTVEPPALIDRCDGFNCTEGTQCCDDVLQGTLCHNASDSTCTNFGNGTYRFCPCSTCFPCGANFECFDNRTASCIDGGIVQHTNQTCGNTNCTAGTVCCDDLIVGALCYYESEHTCTDVGNGTFRFCCCPTCFPCGLAHTCYNRQTHTCVDGAVVPINAPDVPAAPDTPGNETQQRCNTTACPNGMECCDDVLVGPLCFMASEHTCTPLGNGTFRYCCCPTCFPCGDDLRCYNNQSHACVNGVVTPNDAVNTPPAAPDSDNVANQSQCTAPYQPCSNLCYNPQIQNCINGAVISIGQPGTVNTNSGSDTPAAPADSGSCSSP